MAANASRVVSLSWAISETLFAMGAAPVAAAENEQYGQIVREPKSPVDVIDCGLQGSPNFELLSYLKPDLILIQSWQSDLRGNLERIAPVKEIAIYSGLGNAFENATNATAAIGASINREEAAKELVQTVRERIIQLGNPNSPRPVVIAQMIDDVSLTAFTADSLFGSTLTRMNLTNAWIAKPTLMWGGSVIGADELAALPSATVLLIDSPGLAPNESLTQGEIWKTLPAVREGRFHRLPAFWGFGALPTALRFAEATAKVLKE